MDIFELDQIATQRHRLGDAYLEFLRTASLSAGLYALSAGAIDRQVPHTEDEVYYVLRGRGAIQVGEESQAVKAGMLVFVPAHVVHRFHSIEEDLTLLVLFAPAEYTRVIQKNVEPDK
jgi:mannose-6-phosphate isomerase-like protein (cupin superfamily)